MSATNPRESDGPRRRIPERLLVVEDNERLRAMLTQVLSERAAEVRGAASVAEAAALVHTWRPDAVVLDFTLPDGDGLDVLRLIADNGPLPTVVAISGAAEPSETFRLAQLGVRAFVPKPIQAEALQRALDVALDTAPDMVPIVRAAVGHASIQEVEAAVRATMVSEALARTSGSRNAAARLLAVSRQFLQHVLKKDG